MSDLKRINDLYQVFASGPRKSSAPTKAPTRDVINTLRVRYWYEGLKSRAQLKTAYQLEQHFDEMSFKKDDAGKIVHYRNKWSRYERGHNTPQARLFQRVDALEPGSARELNHPLWDVLKKTAPKKTSEEAFLRRLEPEVQRIIFGVKPSGVTSYSKRGPVTQCLLEMLERRASLDVLACLTWLLREAIVQGNQRTAESVVNSLHNVLLIIGIELQSRRIAELLLGVFVRDILPLGAPRQLKFAMSESDYISASAYLNVTVYNTEDAGYKSVLSWPHRVRIMRKLLAGSCGYDVHYALAPVLIPDCPDDEIPEGIMKSIQRSQRLREWGVACIQAGRPGRCPPAAIW
jgi:hypothetical protein